MKNIQRYLVLAALCLFGSSLVAATAPVPRFKADTNLVLSSGASWIGGVAPTAADVACFSNALSAINCTNALGADVTWGAILMTTNAWIGAGGAGDGPGADIFINSGNTLTLGSVLVTNTTLQMTNANKNLIIAGNVILGTNSLWNIGNGRTLYIGGIITTSTAFWSLNKFGNGNLVLSNANTFGNPNGVNPGFYATNGTVTIGADGSLGSGKLMLSGITLQSLDTTPRLITNAVEVDGNLTIGTTATGPFTFAGGVMQLAGGDRVLTANTNVTINSPVGWVSSIRSIIKGGTATCALTLGNQGNSFGWLRITNGSVIVTNIDGSQPGSPSALGAGGITGQFDVQFATANNNSPALRILGTGTQTTAKKFGFTALTNSSSILDLVDPFLELVVNADGIGGWGNLMKMGAGTLTIGASNGTVITNFTGNITNLMGTIKLTSTDAYFPSSHLHIGTTNSNATLDVSALGDGYAVPSTKQLAGSGQINGTIKMAAIDSVISPGGNGVAGTLSITNLDLSAGGVLNFDLTNSLGVGIGNDLIQVSDTLTLGANMNVVINPLMGYLADGDYVLLTYDPTKLQGGTSWQPLVSGNVRGSSYSILTGTPGMIILHVASAPASIIWNGSLTNATDWDTNKSFNWQLVMPNDTRFTNKDSVSFFDSAAPNTNINLKFAVSPTLVTVSNSAVTYTFGDNGKISGGASLLKQGSGLLNISTTNDYVGLTTVGEGTVRALTAAAFGTAASGTVVSNGGQVVLDWGASFNTEAFTIAGAGPDGTGALKDGANQGRVGGRVTLSGDAVIGAAANSLYLSNGVDLAGFNLSFAGAQIVIGNALADTNAPGLIGSGTVRVTNAANFYFRANSRGFSGPIFFGQTAGNIQINDSGYFAGYDALLGSGPVTITNATIRLGGAFTNVVTLTNQMNVIGNLTVGNAADGPLVFTNGTFTLVGATPRTFTASSPVTFGMPIGESVPGCGFTKAGLSNLTLFGANTYTGNTTNQSGALVLKSTASINSPVIQIGTNSVGTNTSWTAILDVTEFVSGYVLKTSQLLRGYGAVAGTLKSEGAATTISPGTALVPYGTLAFTNLDLTAGATFNFDLSNDNTPGGLVNDLVSVVGTLSLSEGSPITLNIKPTSGGLTNGQYVLFTFGAKNWTGSPWTIANPSLLAQRGGTATIVETANAIVLQINNSAPSTALWIGGGSPSASDWDVATSSNWKVGTLTGQQYFNADAALFDDSATVNTVNLPGTVSPQSLTFSNATVALTLNGTGKISGGTGLSKYGAGALTLNTANDYIGLSTIAGGTVTLQNNLALGSSLGGTYLTNGAVLQLSGSGLGILETLALGTNAVLENIANSNAWLGNITIQTNDVGFMQSDAGTLALLGNIAGVSNNLHFQGNGDFVASGIISGAAQRLIKSGTGTLALNATNTYNSSGVFKGGTELRQGTISVNAPAGMGTGFLVVTNAAGTAVTVKNGSTNAFAVANKVELWGNINLNGPNSMPLYWTGVWTNKGVATTNTITVDTYPTYISGIIYGQSGTTNALRILSTQGGVLLFSNAMAYNGDTILGSTLKLLTTNAVPNGAGKGSLILNDGATAGTLDLNGCNAAVNNLTGISASRIYNSGTNGGYLTVNSIVSSTFPGVIADNSGTGGQVNFIKTGFGSFTLTGANTYTGNTTNNAGTLVLAASGSIANSPVIHLAAGATLDANALTPAGGFDLSTGHTLSGSGIVKGIVNVSSPTATLIPGGTGVIGSMAIGSLNLSQGATLNFDLNNTPTMGLGINDLISVAGTLTLGGTITVNINPLTGSLANGTYTLISYGNNGGTSANFVCTSSTIRGANWTVSDNGAGAIILTVGGFAPADLALWTGGDANNPSTWDLNLSANWLIGGNPGQVFFNSDNVWFDDNAGAYTNINLVGQLAPANMVISNVASPLTFASATGGKISLLTNLFKAGAGRVIMATSNDYPGVSFITDGVLAVANPGALGSASVGTVITNTGAITFAFSNMSVAEPLMLSGTGGTNGALYNPFMTNSVTWAGPISIAPADSALVRSDSGMLNLAGAINGGTLVLTSSVSYPYGTLRYTNINISGVVGGGTKLVKQGPGYVVLANTGATYTNGTELRGGILGLSASGTLGFGPLNIISNSVMRGTTTNYVRMTNAVNQSADVVLSAPNAGPFAWNTGLWTLKGTRRRIFADSFLCTNSCIITNDGAVTNIGLTVVSSNGGTLVLAGLCQYPGDTIVGEGTLPGNLRIGANDVLPFGPGVGNLVLSSVNSNAVVDLRGFRLSVNGLLGNHGCLIDNSTGTGNLVLGNNDVTFTNNLGIENASIHLTKVGLGTVTFTNVLAHSGNTTNLAGTILFTNLATMTNTPIVFLASNTTFDMCGTNNVFNLGLNRFNQNLAGYGNVRGLVRTRSANAQITPGGFGLMGTLTITNLDLSVGGNLNFDLSTNVATIGNAVNDLILVPGYVNLGGSITCNIAGNLAQGRYTLVKATTISNAAAAYIVGGPATQSRRTSMVVSQVGNTIVLDVGVGGPPANITWSGGDTNAPDLWDIRTTFNFRTNVNNDTPFYNDDAVLISDAFAGSYIGSYFTNTNGVVSTNLAFYTNIVLQTNVHLSSLVVVDSATNIFVISTTNSSKISGQTGLGKGGAGILIISNANDYNGPTIISNGIVRIAGAGTLGSTVGPTYITNTGTLGLNGLSVGNEILYLGGGGYGGNGLIANSNSTYSANAVTYAILTTNATIGCGNGGWDIRKGYFKGNGFNLVKKNGGGDAASTTNQTLMIDLGDIGVADITITNASALGFGGTTTLGNFTNTVILGPGRLSMTNCAVALNKKLKLTASSFLDSMGGSNRWAGDIDLQGYILTNTPTTNATLELSGIIGNSTNTGTLRLNDAGTLVISGTTNTYAGATMVRYGTLVVRSLARTNQVWPATNASSLGAVSVTNAVIQLATNNTATLKYIGTGDTTDRPIDIARNTSILDASGTGPIVFDCNFISSGAAAKTLVLSGTNVDTNTITGIIPDNTVNNNTTVRKIGSGTWVLTGQNTYTGPTTIGGTGRLKLRDLGSIATSPSVTVSNGATFDVSEVTGGFAVPLNQTLGGVGTNAGDVTLNAGSSIIAGLSVGAPGTNNFANNLILNEGAQLTFDLTRFLTVSNDLINVGGNVVLNGKCQIYINYLNGVLLPGDYLILSAGGFSGSGSIVLGAGYPNASLVYDNDSAPTKLYVRIGAGGSEQKNLEWTGQIDNSWLVDTSVPPTYFNWVDLSGISAIYVDPAVVRFGDSSAIQVDQSINVAQPLTPTSLTFTNQTFNYSLSGSGHISGQGSLYKANAAGLTWGVPDTRTGNTVIDGGSLTLSANGSFNVGSSGSGVMLVANSVGSSAVLTNGGNITSYAIRVANSNNTFGAFYQAGGHVVASHTTSASDNFSIGNGSATTDNDYGYFEISGGDVSATDMSIGRQGNGYLRIKGGDVYPSQNFILSRYTNGFGVVDMSGGTLHDYSGTYASGNYLDIGYSNSAVLNLRGGLVSFANTRVRIMGGGLATNVQAGIINLMTNSTLICSQVQARAFGFNSTFNFEGGTLIAGGNNANFFYVDTAHIGPDGAFIDTGSYAITITNRFSAPTGQGLVNIPIQYDPDNSVYKSGQGYTAPPLVQILRGAGDTTGTNATAVAELYADGTLHQIIITSPGTDYTVAPVVNLIGGLGSNGIPAVLDPVELGENSCGSITKRGDGMLKLTTAKHTFTGDLIAENGLLWLAGPVASIPANVVINAGATVGFTNTNNASLPFTGALTLNPGAGLAPGGTNAAGTMVFEGDLDLDTATLNFDISSTPSAVGLGTNDFIDVLGSFTITRRITVYLSRLGGYYQNGDYVLMRWSGDLNGTFPAKPAIVNDSNPRQTYALNVVSNALVLTISGGADLVWAGIGTDWDNSLTVDWFRGAGISMFNPGDNVVFDDTGVASPNVFLKTNLYPQAVSIASSANYVFEDVGNIGGSTGLSKTGNGTLIISNANTFTGNTYIGGGVLRLGNNANNIGATNGYVTIDNMAALDLNGVILGNTKAINIGTVGGLLTNTAPAAGTVRGTITMNGPLVLGGFNGDLTLTNIISGLAPITKNGTNRVLLQTASNTFTGPVTVNQGELQLNNTNSLPPTSDTLTLNNNATLVLGAGDFTRTLGTGPGAIQLLGNGGFSANSAARVVNFGGLGDPVIWGVTPGFVLEGNMLTFGSPNANNTVTLNNPLVLGATPRVVTVVNNGAALGGQVSGTASLIKEGAGVLILPASNIFTGDLLVNAGTVRGGTNAFRYGTNSFGAEIGSVYVTNGATLDFGGAQNYRPITVQGPGVIGAALTNSVNAASTNWGPIALLSDITIGNPNNRLRFVQGLGTNAFRVTKTGAGQVDILSNAFWDGELDIAAGTLIPYSDDGLGSSIGKTIVRSNAILNINTRNILAEVLQLDGGMLTNGGATPATFSGPITLTADSPIGGNSDIGVYGNIDGANRLMVRGAPNITNFVTLGGSNSFNELIFNGGRVVLAGNHAAGIGQITVVNPVTTTRTELRATNGTLAAPITIANPIWVSNLVNLAVAAGNNGVLDLTGVISGPGMLSRTNNGIGTLFLSGANTYEGGFQMYSDDIYLNNSQAFGIGTVLIGDAVTPPHNPIVINAATDLTGVKAINNLIVAYTNFALGGKSIEFAGSVTLNNIAGSVGISCSATSIFSGLISDGTPTYGIDKDGPGTLVLSHANTYKGITRVNAGTLVLANTNGSASGNGTLFVGSTGTAIVNPGASVGGLASISGLVVNDGLLAGGVNVSGTLAGNGAVLNSAQVTSGTLAPGSLGQAGTLTFSNSLSLFSATLSLDLTNSTTTGGNVNDLVNIVGDLNIIDPNLAIQVRWHGLGYPVGKWVIATWSGECIGLTPTPVVTGVNGLGKNQKVTVTYDIPNKQMLLEITGGMLTWTGQTSGDWDMSIVNWTAEGVATNYTDGDGVLFGDEGIAAGQTNINIVGNVLPANIFVNSGSYNFGGAGIIGGTHGIVMNSTGLLTLNHTNTFTGVSHINAGTLQLNHAGLGGDTILNGTLQGVGVIGSNLTINGTFSPGLTGPAEISAASATLGAGGTYLWQINDGAGLPGVGFDSLALAGTLDVQSFDTNPFVIRVVGLTPANLPGEITGFDASKDQSWLLVQTPWITNFNAAKVKLDLTNFVNDLKGGSFVVTNAPNGLVLKYLTTNTAVPTVIVIQPVDQFVYETGSATFTVAATGGEPLAYQWFEITGQGSTLLPNATNASLVLSNLTLADSGRQFQAVITNASSLTYTSTVAKLTVLKQITLISPLGLVNGFALGIDALPNYAYWLECRSNLLDKTWTYVPGSGITNQSGVQTLSDTDTTAPSKLYRLGAKPQ